MRNRGVRWVAVLVLVAGSALAGNRVGHGPMTAAQTDGGSTSGGGGDTSSGGSGGSGGESGTSGGSGSDRSSGGSGGGDDSGGGGPSVGGGADVTVDGGGSRVGGGADVKVGGDKGTPDDGGSGGSGGGGAGGGGGDGEPDGGYSISTTSTPAPHRRVAHGEQSDCPAGTPAHVRCFRVDDGEDSDGVEIPDGTGGRVVVDLDGEAAFSDGTSTSGGSNVELSLEVDVRTGDVIHVEEESDDTRQAVLLTIAVMLMVLLLVGLGAVLVRLQRRAAGGEL